MNRLEGRKGLASGHCLSGQHVRWIKHGTKTIAATKKRIHQTTNHRDYEMRDCFVAKSIPFHEAHLSTEAARHAAMTVTDPPQAVSMMTVNFLVHHILLIGTPIQHRQNVAY